MSILYILANPDLPSIYDTLKVAMTQVPNLCVLGYIVYIFLTHSTRRDNLIQELHEESQEARALSRQIIKENTEALIKNTLVTQEVLEELKEIKSYRKHTN